MAFKNTHPFTDRGVLEWLQEVGTGRKCSALSKTFNTTTPVMWETLNRMVENDWIFSISSDGDRRFFAKVDELPEPGVMAGPRIVNVMVAPAMTVMSAQRMGAAWSPEGARR
jgi:hypothetical protein